MYKHSTFCQAKNLNEKTTSHLYISQEDDICLYSGCLSPGGLGPYNLIPPFQGGHFYDLKIRHKNTRRQKMSRLRTFKQIGIKGIQHGS